MLDQELDITQNTNSAWSVVDKICNNPAFQGFEKVMTTYKNKDLSILLDTCEKVVL